MNNFDKMTKNKSIKFYARRFFTPEELSEFFGALAWESAKYSDLAAKALANSDSVFCAYSGEKLVGLMNGITDGAMCVYCHYLAVHPDFQGAGIGGKLTDMFLENYKNIPVKVLVASATSVDFYQKKGFFVLKSGISMYHSTIIKPD
jgi:ribosomal protein S18 acetylase RimI-like enzyme